MKRLLGLFLMVSLMPQCGPTEASKAASRSPEEFELPADPGRYQPLAGFGTMDMPVDNPLTLAKAKLGRQLFFDARLSGDGSRSCYSCHLNEHGLSDNRPTAIGAYEKVLTRNSPTLWNIGFHTFYYWDGRKDTLEGQAFAAWKGGNMGAGEDIPRILEAVNGVAAYQAQFQEIFGGPATADNVPQALAAYMRTIIGGNTAYDRWKAGDESAVSDAAKRGYDVFQKAKCDECHAGVLFTDLVFHNVGIGFDPSTGEFADVGRNKVTGEDKDLGAIKTPTLRDVVDSGPYFHDGSVASLEAAVRVMVVGGIPNPHTDEKLKKAELTEAEIGDLIEFLRSLDEEGELSEPSVP